MAAPEPGAIPEPRLNQLLRAADWRFLLRRREAPALVDPHAAPAAARLVAGGDGDQLAVLGFPGRAGLAAARAALAPGGEVVCLWRLPRPGGPRRARARLRRAGFGDIRVHWAGPDPRRPPQFWLPLDSVAAKRHLLASRPPRGAAGRLLRRLWRLADRLGLLAPCCAIGKLEGTGADAEGPAELLPGDAAQLLLTGGGRSINKVVSLPFAASGAPLPRVVKFARVAAADAALEHEAAVLAEVERAHPDLPGVPRLLGRGRRAGRLAVAESAVPGEPLIGDLSAERFEPLSALVTALLTGLVGERPRSGGEWRQRLLGEPLAAFERDFGALLPAGAGERLRARIESLPALPPACEHRDCSPWNVVLGPDGAAGLLDWESAEPDGLPGLDLAYFLANSVFILDGALDSGRTLESYRRLRGGDSPHSATVRSREAEYCRRLGIADLADLRLLAWLVHSRSDHRHLSMAAAGPPSPEALRQAPYLGLVEVELELA